MRLPLLPAGFSYAWQFTGKGHIPEADSADAKLAHKSPRATANRTSVVLAGGKFGLPLSLDHQRCASQVTLLLTS
jgi:hypothetical protein